MRFLLILPLLCYLVAFILSFLMLFAGHKEGFMEDYALIRLNTSAIGYDLVDNTFGGVEEEQQNEDDDDDGGFFDGITDKIGDLADDVRDKIVDIANDLGNEVAGRLAKEFGVSEWYSLHLMSGCEGMYKPNATAPGAGLNITGCSGGELGYYINLTAILDKELSVGPLDFNLNDIDWPSQIQDSLDTVNSLIKAAAVLFVLAIAFTGVGMLLSLASIFMPARRLLSLVHVAVALLAMVCLMVGAIMATVGPQQAADEINDHGERVGVVAHVGSKFITIAWVAFAMSVICLFFFIYDFFKAWKDHKRSRGHYSEKRNRHSTET